jgi:GT2 family glycosyltransferase
VKEISRNKIVYDCMDEHAGFTTNSIHHHELEQNLCQTADLVITSSENLYQKASKTNQNAILIRNGSDIDHFYDLPICHESMIKKPIIGYYGAISDWFDVELIASSARHYPDYSFVLIGHTYGADTSSLEKLPNVYLLGEKNYQELPEYLSCFDVCLIPFKINSLTLATNPVKFYEYISSGKPVVTTALPELLPHQDICYIARDHGEFIKHIQTALDESDQAMISKRKAVAMANSWQSRVGEFEKGINSLFPSVSIIIISFNNRAITQNCIESVYKYSRYPNFEVIIIDNASSDDAPQYLHSIEQQFPHLKIIYNKQNLGFAKANNQGVKISGGEYIILLNNDTIVTNDWISQMVHHIDRNQTIGLLGPVTNNIGNEQKITVDYKDINTMQRFAGNYTKTHQDEISPVSMLALFCTIVRKSDLEQVGYLSEDYEIGMFEDDDLSQKFKAIGKKIIMTDDVFIHHIGRASFSKLADEKYMAIFNKNKAIYENKWGPWISHKPRDETK